MRPERRKHQFYLSKTICFKKVVVLLKENYYFDAKRAPEATLGDSKNRVEEERGPRLKTETSKRPKVWKCLMKLMFFRPTAIFTCNSQVKVEVGRANVENTACF